MRTTRTKRAIRDAFFRLGLHATPRAVVHALAQQGVQVAEEFVRQVRFELLKEATRATVAGFPGRRRRQACAAVRRDFRGGGGTGEARKKEKTTPV